MRSHQPDASKKWRVEFASRGSPRWSRSVDPRSRCGNAPTLQLGNGGFDEGRQPAVGAGFADVDNYYLSFADWARDDACPVVK